MITRGTTPTIVIELPFAAAELVTGAITFAQAGEVCFERSLDDCTRQEQTLLLKLTQEETMQLDALAALEVQITATNTVGDEVASNIMEGDVGRLLREGVTV